LPPTARAQPDPKVADLEKRVRDLEEIVRRLEAELARDRAAPPQAELTQAPAEPTPAQPQEQRQPDPAAGGLRPEGAVVSPREGGGGGGRGAGGGPLAGWNDGFYLRSADNRFNLRITGQIQTDYRGFLENGNDYTDIDTFLIRRARLGIEATVFDYFEFRFLPDFGQGQSVIQDSYLNVHYVDEFQVEAGKFKQPFSYEQLIQDRFVPTVERSIIDQLVPARDVGVMLHGQKLLDDRLDWYVSVSNGEINGNTDVNGRKDVAARVAVRPFHSETFGPLLRGLQLGFAATAGTEQEPVTPSPLRTPATIPFFQYNSTVRADGVRTRYSPEVAYFYEGLGFAAQYYEQEQQLRPAFTGPTSVFLERIPTTGAYAMVTYLLTGETRTTYSEPVTPRHNFDPLRPIACPGAWEVVARVSYLRVSPDVFRPGVLNLADPALYANETTELTLGFNWYLNKYVRTQFNYEHAWFDQPVLLAPPPFGYHRSTDAVLARFQVIF
jgi:phosphate-selective porin OprO/OprP